MLFDLTTWEYEDVVAHVRTDNRILVLIGQTSQGSACATLRCLSLERAEWFALAYVTT
jgi:hypothetical protein